MRWLGVSAVPFVIAILGACSTDPIETTDGGTLLQVVAEAMFEDPPPTRLILIVDGSATTKAERIRARVLQAVEEAADELAPASGHRPTRWTPVDIEARILWIGGRTIYSTAEDARLRWREEQASVAGAAAFVRGVAEALAMPSARGGEPAGALEALRNAVALTPPDPRWQRTIVLATSQDDTSAVAEHERTFEAEDYPRLIPFFPSLDDERGRCSDDVKDWRLTKWLEAQRVDTVFACGEQRLNGLYWDSGRRRITTGNVATRDDGTPACRVRVHLWSKDRELEARCDPRRGWSGPVQSDSSEGEGFVTCDVAMLAGDDGARCRDPRSTCAGCASGWCIVDETDPRFAGAWIRFAGGAAPARPTFEIVCNLAP